MSAQSYVVAKINTDSLGFPLKVAIVVAEAGTLGAHLTYEDESGHVAADAEHEIHILSGLAGGELINTAAHEAYHLFYSVREHITADEETQAQVFGQLVRRIVESVR